MNSSYSTQWKEGQTAPPRGSHYRGPGLGAATCTMPGAPWQRGSYFFRPLHCITYNWFLFKQIFPLERKQDSHYHGVADGEIDNRYRMPTTTLNSCFYYGLMVYVQCDKPWVVASGVTADADMLVRVCRLEFSAPFLSHLVQDITKNIFGFLFLSALQNLVVLKGACTSRIPDTCED